MKAFCQEHQSLPQRNIRPLAASTLMPHIFPMLSRSALLSALLLALPEPGLTQADYEDDLIAAGQTIQHFIRLSRTFRLKSIEGQELLGDDIEELASESVGHLSIPDRILMIDKGKVVARLPADGEEHPLDQYLYLCKSSEGQWIIEAVRELALPGSYYERRQVLRLKGSRMPKEENELRNIDLTFSSDAALRLWFLQNRAELERLRSIATTIGPLDSDDSGFHPIPEADEVISRLGGRDLWASSDGSVSFAIGGTIDDELGFFYLGKTQPLPRMSHDGYIWVEPMGDRWYLYKTT